LVLRSLDVDAGCEAIAADHPFRAQILAEVRAQRAGCPFLRVFVRDDPKRSRRRA
jgi:hypothetical protein